MFDNDEERDQEELTDEQLETVDGGYGKETTGQPYL
jgi:bacteriocin-like protein